MPGKVNPVIVESPDDGRGAGRRQRRHDRLRQTGSFHELNVMLPVTAAAMLESIDAPAAATATFSAQPLTAWSRRSVVRRSSSRA